MNTERPDRIVVRYADDSGAGMQLVGDRFTGQAAVFGNDLTFPNGPAGIRGPRAMHTAPPANAADVATGGAVIADPFALSRLSAQNQAYVLPRVFRPVPRPAYDD